ncbi:MAG: ATP-binding protein [Thermoguttaceae bacterium]
MSDRRRLTPDEEKTIRQLLISASVPRDSLSHTDEFTTLKQCFEQSGGRRLSNSDFWQLLVRVGKRGVGGPRKKGTPAPQLSVEEQLEMLRLFPEGTGTRDRLPYTDQERELRERFEKWTGRRLTPHEFWRALSSLAKRSRKPKPIYGPIQLLGLPPETVENLEFTNPWWRGMPAPEPPRFRRWAFGEAWRRLHSGLTPAVAVRGPRQVGKTTIQQQIIEQLLLIKRVGPERILRVQFDDIPQMGALRQPILSLVRWYEEKVLRQPINGMARKGQSVYLLFDEVQNLKSWAAEIKSLVDHATARVLITGSSSLRMERGKDSLAGRVSWIDLGPLRLREIAGIRQEGDLPTVAGAAELKNWARREF